MVVEEGAEVKIWKINVVYFVRILYLEMHQMEVKFLFVLNVKATRAKK